MDSMIFTYKYKLCHRNRYRLYTDIDIDYNIGCAWGVLGVCLGVPWVCLGCAWGMLGCAWRVPGYAWRMLGCAWGVPGRAWGVPWVCLGCAWACSGCAWLVLDAYSQAHPRHTPGTPQIHVHIRTCVHIYTYICTDIQ